MKSLSDLKEKKAEIEQREKEEQQRKGKQRSPDGRDQKKYWSLNFR